MRKLNAPIKLGELARIVDATLQGDPDVTICSINNIQNSQEGDITFLVNPSYRKFLYECQATAVILTEDDLSMCPVNALLTSNPRLTLAKLAKFFVGTQAATGNIHPSAVIGKNCELADDVNIGPHCVIQDHTQLGPGVVLEAGVVIGEHCVLGARTKIHANVTIYSDVHLGEDCAVHSGTVIGSDGFGYAQDKGQWVKMPHLGGVRIGNRVEIGSNTSIDRGFLDNTIIHDGVIIDNLVQIAHNVEIGKHTAIAGCAGVAGSAKLGEHCMIGGSANIGGHLELGDNIHVTGMSAITRSFKEPGVYSSGFPARENTVWRKNVARFLYLNDMAKRLKEIEQKVYNAEQALMEED